MNKLMMYLNVSEKHEKTKTNGSRWQERMKIRAEINEMET